MLRKSKRLTEVSALETDLKNTALVANVILQNIEDGIVLIDSQQIVTTFNVGATQITGIPAKQAISQSWNKVLKLTDRHGVAASEADNPVKQAFNTKQSVRQDNAFIATSDQDRVPLHLIVTPLINPSGEVTAVIVVMRDMSWEREQEEAKTDFVSTASHEMRTPLAALEGYLTLIMSDSNLSSQTMEQVKKAHQSSLHLGQLFKNLLTTSQSEDGRLSHRPQIFGFNDLIKQTVAENRRHADPKEIKLHLAVETDSESQERLFQLNADPRRIQELLSNILDNAIKYTDPGGQINISLKAVNGFAQIKVEDSGYGVSPKDLPHLFQKFYRVDNSQPGIGLGLFICKEIVKLYKGDLWAESEVGRGSIFYINLPRHELSEVVGD